MTPTLLSRALAATTILLLTPAATAHAAAPADITPGALASFEGRTLDLAESWGAARACAVTPTGTTCYRTEAAMDAALATTMSISSTDAEINPLGTCGSSL